MQDSSLKRFIRDPARLSEQINGDFPRIAAIESDGDNGAVVSFSVSPQESH